MADDVLQIRSETRGEAEVIAPEGDVDLSRSPTLRQALREAQARKPRRIVVDLAAVDYMDSSGVATLVEALQIARRSNTRIVLCGMRDRVRSIFEIARLDTVFTIAPSLADALTA